MVGQSNMEGRRAWDCTWNWRAERSGRTDGWEGSRSRGEGVLGVIGQKNMGQEEWEGSRGGEDEVVGPNEEAVGGQEGKEKQDRIDKWGMKRQIYDWVGRQESAETSQL